MPKRVKPVASEHEVQSCILGWLEQKHIFHYRQNTGKARLKGFWVKFGDPGAPDIVAVISGRFIGIEVKRVGEELSKDQYAYGLKLMEAGGKYIVAYSLEDVTKVLNT